MGRGKKETVLLPLTLLRCTTKEVMVNIVVDPGHGGEDSGAVSQTGIMEKDVTLEYANKLLLYLDYDIGHSAQLTRYLDMSVSLGDRCLIANSAGAEIFVSIHCNSCETPNSAHGFEIFHYTGSESGKRLADCIHNCWLESHETSYTRGVKSAEFHVLKHTHMPAVLLELGFINNDRDLTNMLNIFWMGKAIKAITGGIFRYEDPWSI